MCFKNINKSISASDLPDIHLPILEEEEDANPLVANDDLNTAFDDSDDDSDNEMPELEDCIQGERTDDIDTNKSFETTAMDLFSSPRNWYSMLLASWTTEDCDDSLSISMRDIRKYTTIYSISKKLNIVGFPKFTFGKAMEAYLTDRTAPEPFWT